MSPIQNVTFFKQHLATCKAHFLETYWCMVSMSGDANPPETMETHYLPVYKVKALMKCTRNNMSHSHIHIRQQHEQRWWWSCHVRWWPISRFSVFPSRTGWHLVMQPEPRTPSASWASCPACQSVSSWSIHWINLIVVKHNGLMNQATG